MNQLFSNIAVNEFFDTPTVRILSAMTRLSSYIAILIKALIPLQLLTQKHLRRTFLM